MSVPEPAPSRSEITATLAARSRAQTAELARFVIVGGSAVAVDFAVYFGLVHVVPFVPTVIAKAASFIAGAALAFALNRGFVFRADGAASRQIGPFVVLYLISLGLNGAVNSTLLAHGALRGVAWFCATGTSTVSNFLGMKFIVFRKRRGLQ